MVYRDRVYGKIEITEPVLLELMELPSLQRLKDVTVGVYFRNLFGTSDYSRFEHCLGVMCLLKKFQAPLEEQISGLIHDVSHTAFSHTIDYVYGTGHLQNHQDNQHKTVVMNSDIPTILKKYGYQLDYILNEENFPLLETKLPDLCADRIDYSWRWMVNQPQLTGITQADVKKFFGSLKTAGNKWVITDFDIAEKFVKNFLKLNSLIWANPETFISSTTHAELLKYALEKRYISENDLNTTDTKVMKKLEKRLPADQTLAGLYGRARTQFKYQSDEKNPDIQGAIKSRAINPWVGEKRYSELVPEYKAVLEKTLKPIHYSLRLIK